MRVGLIMAEVINYLKETYLQDIGTELEIFDGAEHLNDTDFASSPKLRIVWFPTSTKFEGNTHVGANPNMQRLALQNYEIHMKGPSYDEVGELVRYVILALEHKLYSPQVEYSGTYIDKGNILQSGVGYKLDAEVKQVIPRRPLRKVKVSETETHSKLQGSNELVPP